LKHLLTTPERISPHERVEQEGATLPSGPSTSALSAAVGVVHQGAGVVAVVVAGPQAHVEGVQGQVGAQRGGDLPAHDAAAEDVQDEGAVDPAGEGADVGDVGDPQAIGAVGGEGAG